MCSCVVGAEAPQIEEREPIQEITDVYIGVFFDGTGNNMVQKSGVYKDLTPQTEQDSNHSDNKKTVWYISNNVQDSNASREPNTLPDKEEFNVTLGNEMVLKDGKYARKHKPTESKNTEGYSNIAILHDSFVLLEKCKENPTEPIITKLFYIEGAGTTDISCFSSSNINGLGFGLGNTGVTALVSKAVKYVTDFIRSSNLSKKVNIHFYIFGFSRGATCARLFSRLITRGKNGAAITRESEFEYYYAENLRDNDGKLMFLDDYPNKTIEFLGIYDTVVSIGFLQQKDGEVHPIMKKLYDWSDNYKDNWHYKNVYEYGLSLCDEDAKKIKQICHICAIDEFRENFALTDVGKEVPGNAVEIFIPGCHSDVGGGYPRVVTEQEIVLSKYRASNIQKNENLILESLNSLLNIGERIATTLPQNNQPYKKSDGSTQPMSCEGLRNLGWIDKNCPVVNDDITENIKNYLWKYTGIDISDSTMCHLGDNDHLMLQDIYNGSDNKNGAQTDYRQKFVDNNTEYPYTISVTTNKTNIKFKRNVQGGYSNIPLKMMVDFMNSKKGTIAVPEAFKDKTPPVPNSSFFNISPLYNINVKDLQSFGEKMCNAITDVANGQRIWMLPKDEFYKTLRLKYFHFTSTSSLFHINNPFNDRNVDTLEFDKGNLGNTPNFDLDGHLCRIIYHSPPTGTSCGSVEAELHYMYEYNGGVVKEM